MLRNAQGTWSDSLVYEGLDRHTFGGDARCRVVEFRGEVDHGPFPWDRTADGKLDVVLCVGCGTAPARDGTTTCRACRSELPVERGDSKVKPSAKQYVLAAALDSVDKSRPWRVKELTDELGMDPGSRAQYQSVERALKFLRDIGMATHDGVRGRWTLRTESFLGLVPVSQRFDYREVTQ